ncbi:E3 ubiquitin-protein ligase TTC3 isoform X1 [Channa argus]|uniref:E3 ubiquitin-protein ligase TTC3 isoform X1 n=1 Tax=Channa argus TaxID=215402 RepID=UPI00351F8372
MSESDSDPEYRCDCDNHHAHMDEPVRTYQPPENVFDQWGRISVDTKKDAGQRMKVCSFWLPILLQREESSNIVSWAVNIGIISHKGSEDLCLRHLHRIEILEAILRAMEKGSLKREQTRHIFSITNMLNLHSYEALEDARHWLESTEEPNINQYIVDLGPINVCYATLQLVFTEFTKYIFDMSTNLEETMKELMARPSDGQIEKSEEMKKKGNENFQKEQYEDAVKFYSKAIKFYPDNHIIYGNRALSYIRSKMYLKAVCDGKRATLIKPLWAKGHYRYCEALFYLGEVKMAIEANVSAQKLCKDDHEGMKDLEQQQLKFVIETAELRAGQLKSKNKRSDSRNRANAAEAQQQSVKANYRIGLTTNKVPQAKVSEVKKDKQPVKNESTTQADGSAKDSKSSKSEFSSNNGKGESSTVAKKKSKKRNCQSEEENQKVAEGKAVALKGLRSMVQDAHSALSDLRSRNAEHAFSQALAILEKTPPKELGLSSLDVLLLLYGRACALTEIGQPEELAEAQKLLEKIKSFEERTFQSLVYYAVGRVYLKENRFAVALEQFSDSLQMVKNQITPGKLTWPLTKEIVKETQPDYFKEVLDSAIELCKFPPPSYAICRLEKCLKPEIYLTDPDFKGFIQICCCQSCTVEYHIICWKILKTSIFSEKNDKDFLQAACLTPDCVGKICNIKIYGPTGLVKCRFEAATIKPQTPKKPKVNQKCTSLKKLKSKDERRLKRKQHKLSFQDKQVINNEILQKKEDSSAHSQQKAWLLYRDRVLLQISQNMELLREEKALHVSALTTSLKPWLELDSSRGNQLAQRLLYWQQEPLETLGQAVELLLQRRNRVWARVFIQLLSSSPDVNLKLNTWACKLNDAGLNAAKSFIERHTEYLEQLNLDLLLNFSPFRELIIEKLGTGPEHFSSIGLTLTEYLKQAPPHDMRLFIWTLEEHRNEYLSCHTILDEYFDMMDGHCSVLKKSESQNNSPLKAKNRGRKKKQKEPKGVIVLSGMRGVTPRDEWDQDFFEDDSLSFLHPVDSFTVPSHLRDQVADFEGQYQSTRSRSHYKQILDNNPDPTKESLYDYFAQILDEHGPLVAEDPLLVGELENFPSVAQLKIQEGGGFESFLLESLRFIKMGNRIGLAKHAVCLQQAEHGASLDDLDVIADLATQSPYPDLHEDAFPNYVESFLSAETINCSVLPNPYEYEFQSANGIMSSVSSIPGTDLYSHWSNGDDEQQDCYFSMKDNYKINLYTGEVDGGEWEMVSSLGELASQRAEEIFLKKHAAVQTCQENMRSVAVNTEIHEPFESCQGDINMKEKNNQKLEQEIKKMVNGCDKLSLKQKDDITSLEEEIQMITTNIQVTNKELALFQQKLEEEIKKDQKEKKANQEILKTLKQETEKLVEEHGSLARNIREKKAEYEAKLNDFLELGNQSATEKMSLEDEIKRCETVLTSATRRSNTAQLSVVESSRDQALYSLYAELADAKALLSKLEEVSHRYPNPDLEISKNTWRTNVQDAEKKISTAEIQFQEHIDQVKNGRRVTELIPVHITNQPGPAPAAPSVAAKEFTPKPSAQGSNKALSPVPPLAADTALAPAQPQHKAPARTLEPSHSTVFDKAIERLGTIFSDYTRSDLVKFIQQLRSSTGGSLNSMALQDVVGGVTQLILDHQEKLSSARSNIMGRRNPATPPLVTPAPAWQSVVPPRATHSKALNMEDPCIICHDDMSPDDICVLECRHSFHKECIRSWFKEQSTCPTCRDHALLPEDFPVLPGRRRQAP